MSDVVVVPRWIVIVGALVALLGLTMFLASLIVGYVGDEYGSPSFSEHSVPAARPY
jgi:hypothetical protein